jgi:hypothetical protein
LTGWLCELQSTREVSLINPTAREVRQRGSGNSETVVICFEEDFRLLE